MYTFHRTSREKLKSREPPLVTSRICPAVFKKTHTLKNNNNNKNPINRKQ